MTASRYFFLLIEVHKNLSDFQCLTKTLFLKWWIPVHDFWNHSDHLQKDWFLITILYTSQWLHLQKNWSRFTILNTSNRFPSHNYSCQDLPYWHASWSLCAFGINVHTVIHHLISWLSDLKNVLHNQSVRKDPWYFHERKHWTSGQILILQERNFNFSHCSPLSVSEQVATFEIIISCLSLTFSPFCQLYPHFQ